MKPPQEKYDLIPSNPDFDKGFMNFPGVYCQGCGADFALYSYSAYQPDALDENKETAKF